MIDVRLIGGPAHGVTIEVADSRTPILLEGHGVPEGCAARYRPADARRRVNHAYRFESLEAIAARIPAPGTAAA
jgi:hypothetical protein